MTLAGSVFIDRKSSERAIKTVQEAGKHMRDNKLALFAFPEGTRSHLDKPTLLPFKKGVFHLAIETQLPIVPLVCENYHHLYDSKTRFDGGHLRIAVLPPVSTEGLTVADTEELMKKVYDSMLERLLRFDEGNDEKMVRASSESSSKSEHGLAGLVARL